MTRIPPLGLTLLYKMAAVWTPSNKADREWRPLTAR